MKPTHVIVKALLSAALLWAPAARALILTSWELPSNVKSLEGEYAASTNIATVLNFGRAADGQSATMLYRNSNGKLAAVTVGEDAFLSRFSLVKGRGGTVRPAAAASFQASDESGNYADVGTWLGEAGGDGWGGPWKQMPGSATVTAADAGFNTEMSGSRDLSLAPTSATGEIAVGRQLSAPLESGEFSITAWMDVGPEFRGFALYDKLGEVLRVGAGSEDGTAATQGYVYAYRGGDGNILFFKNTLGSGDGLEYTLTWSRMDDGMHFSWKESSGYWEDEDSYFRPPSVTIQEVSEITAIALVSTGVDKSQQGWSNPEIAFSKVSVSGTAAVPEPGTLALLAAGTALLAWRRRSRRA